MTCAEVLRWIDLYVEDGLSEEVRQGVDRHVLVCRRCAFELNACQQTRRKLRIALGDMVARPGFRERLSARLHYEFAADFDVSHEENPLQRQLPLHMPAEDGR